MTDIAANVSASPFCSRKRMLALVVFGALLIFAAFSVNVKLAHEFDRLQTFEQLDVLFEANPNWRRKCFATGFGPTSKDILHPNLCNIFGGATFVAAKTLYFSGLVKSEDMARYAISLLVSPSATALQMCLLLATGVLLGVPSRFLLPLLAICAFSFSNLIYGSVPEHLALGGASIALTFFMLSLTIKQGKPYYGLWVFCGFMTASITVTNIFFYGLALLLSFYKVFGFKASAQKVIFIGLSAAVLVFVFKFGMDHWLERGPVDPDRAIDEISRHFHTAPEQRLLKFPLALATAIAPSSIGKKPTTNPFKSDLYDFQFTLDSAFFESPAGWSFNALFVLTIIGGLIAAVRFRKEDRFAGIYLVAAIVLAFNAILHSFWGDGFFLYSQHWVFSSIILFCPLFLHLKLGKITDRLAVAFLSAFACFVMFNNYTHVTTMLEQLQAAGTVY